LKRWVDTQFDEWLEENREDDEEDRWDLINGGRM
jgi:hypothetical protein